MSKMVVGMNSRPAITPHRIDCGLRKTTPNDRTVSAIDPEREADGLGFGSNRNSTTLIARPPMPMPIQKVFHEMPDAIIGPTTNCPADPPAMPNICVAPMSVAARDGGKLVVAM